MTQYRIIEWNERYEVNDSNRPLKAGQTARAGPLEFVRLTVFGEKLGKGYRRMKKFAGARRALEVFGLFCKLLEIAGDCARERRGIVPGPEEVAEALEVPVRQVVNAYVVLEKVPWIQRIPQNSADSAENCIQHNTTQHNTIQPTTPPQAPLKGGDTDGLFDRFWSAYPKKKAKDAARKAFAKRKPSEALLASFLAAIEAQKCTDDWTREDGRYIPYPASWLNGGRWEDHIGLKIEETPEQIQARLHAKGIL